MTQITRGYRSLQSVQNTERSIIEQFKCLYVVKENRSHAKTCPLQDILACYICSTSICTYSIQKHTWRSGDDIWKQDVICNQISSNNEAQRSIIKRFRSIMFEITVHKRSPSNFKIGLIPHVLTMASVLNVKN